MKKYVVLAGLLMVTAVAVNLIITDGFSEARRGQRYMDNQQNVQWERPAYHHGEGCPYAYEDCPYAHEDCLHWRGDVDGQTLTMPRGQGQSQSQSQNQNQPRNQGQSQRGYRDERLTLPQGQGSTTNRGGMNAGGGHQGGGQHNAGGHNSGGRHGWR
ncbi:hypothetical protein FWH13_02365 [Candidatus Saccharibacteria bacterium]|nr:hypothetical protein [Candidatus Saccharibacteria bacterium]